MTNPAKAAWRHTTHRTRQLLNRLHDNAALHIADTKERYQLEVNKPHQPAHAKAYICSDSDLWFILWTATLSAFLASLPGHASTARIISAAILGAVIGALTRLIWSTWGQRDTPPTPGGRHHATQGENPSSEIPRRSQADTTGGQ